MPESGVVAGQPVVDARGGRFAGEADQSPPRAIANDRVGVGIGDGADPIGHGGGEAREGAEEHVARDAARLVRTEGDVVHQAGQHRLRSQAVRSGRGLRDLRGLLEVGEAGAEPSIVCVDGASGRQGTTGGVVMCAGGIRRSRCDTQRHPSESGSVAL